MNGTAPDTDPNGEPFEDHTDRQARYAIEDAEAIQIDASGNTTIDWSKRHTPVVRNSDGAIIGINWAQIVGGERS